MAAQEESIRDVQARLKGKDEHTEQRPLIDRVSNQWRNDKEGAAANGAQDYDDDDDDDDVGEIGCCDLDHANSCPNATTRLCTSRRFRRMIVCALVALLAVCYFWSRYLRPQLEEDWAYEAGFVSQENGTYGIAKGGDWNKDTPRIEHLDHKLLPGSKDDPHGKRRLVFVGDVHGCKQELIKLLHKISFNKETDHLILTGDAISKGPDNVGVLDQLIRLKATSVRGNHEDRILHVARSFDLDQPLDEATSSKGNAKDVALLKHLKKHHLKYLRDMPLMLHIPALPAASKPNSTSHSPIDEHILVVHAGLVPGVRLDKQDPYFVMNMRSINRRTHVPSVMRDGKNAKPWFDVWNWYNDRISKQEISSFAQYMGRGTLSTFANIFVGSRKGSKPRPLQVIYGHDSKAGLQIKRWSKGLDSGCVSGNELTAMVLNAQGQFELHSVGCKNYRD